MKTPTEVTSTMNAKVEAIRRQNELTPEAKRARIAAAYKPAKLQMAALESAAREAKAAAETKATQTAFGVSDLAKTPGDAALVSMAFRQAADKVADVTNPADAARLLEQATTSGDETPARAVAQHADKMSSALFQSAQITGVGATLTSPPSPRSRCPKRFALPARIWIWVTPTRSLPTGTRPFASPARHTYSSHLIGLRRGSGQRSLVVP
jgi:hypothetical protein